MRAYTHTQSEKNKPLNVKGDEKAQDKALQVPHPLFQSVFLTGQIFTKFHTHYFNQSSSGLHSDQFKTTL